MDRLSFADAAAELEILCEHIESLDELDTAIHAAFSRSQDSLKDSIDRRIKFLKYAESQVAIAKGMRDEWSKRAFRFETTIERIKADTLGVMKANPDLPYKGTIGGFKRYKNSVPSLEMDENWAEDPSYFVTKTISSLDKERLRADLKTGKEIPGVSLRYGEHVRVSTEI